MSMHNHNSSGRCDSCDHGPQYSRDKEEFTTGLHGWHIHIITEYDSQSPTGTNYHTHGLLEKFEHPDLQIVIPIDPQVAAAFFWSIVPRIEAGEKFKAGDTIDDVNGFTVRFIDAIEDKRAVLRMILPDRYGELDKDKISGNLHLQYD